MAITRDAVLREALLLADEKGLDDLSLRALAARLGVQAPTLYWHVANKADLLDALSDAIMGEALTAIAALPPLTAEWDAWRPWLLEASAALRAAMLAHRDGARIVAGARLSTGRLEYSEIVIRALVDHGLPVQEAWLTTLATQRLTLGHVLAEQGPDSAPVGEAATEFTRRYPLLAEGVATYFGAGGDGEDIFRRSMRLLLGLPAEG